MVDKGTFARESGIILSDILEVRGRDREVNDGQEVILHGKIRLGSRKKVNEYRCV